MKKFTKLAWALCLSICTTSVGATNYYVSSSGSNDNTGYSPDSPVLTLNKIDQLLREAIVVEPHTVYVDGMMLISNEPVSTSDSQVGYVITKGEAPNRGPGGFFFQGGHWDNVTIEGMNLDAKGNPTDGFDASREGRCFAIDGGTHIFKNLIFQNGVDLINDGGNGFWLRSSIIHFENCHFKDNKANRNSDGDGTLNTNGMGGAVIMLVGTYSFKDCLFEGNENTNGSAIFNSGCDLAIEGCTFKNNNASGISGSTGIILATQRHGSISNTTIERSLFLNNSVAHKGGCLNVTGGGSKNGNPIAVTIKNTSMIGNSARDYGGAICVDIPVTAGDHRKVYTEVLIMNSTIYGNMVTGGSGYGGAIYLSRPGSEEVKDKGSFTMVNTTVTNNWTNGDNGGFSGGIRINSGDQQSQSSWMKKRIYNCIIDANYSRAAEELFDFGMQDAPGVTPDDDYELIVANSYIGKAMFTEDMIPSEYINMINYYEGDPDEDYVNESGLTEILLRNEDIDEFRVVTLDEGAPAYTFGNAEYLEEFGITTDQLYRKRKINEDDNSCAVGALEATYEDLEAEGDLYKNFPDIPISECEGDDCPCEGDDCPCEGDDCPCEGDDCDDSIDGANLSANSLVVTDGIVQLTNQSVVNVTLTVTNPAGATVASGINQVSIENLPSGLYIVKAQTDKGTIVQKVLK